LRFNQTENKDDGVECPLNDTLYSGMKSVSLFYG